MEALNDSRILRIIPLVLIVAVLCPFAEASDEYVLTVAYEQIRFVAQPEKGYVVKQARRTGGISALAGTLFLEEGQESGKERPRLTVAAVCMNAKTDRAVNLQTFTGYIREASEKGAKLIVFPEIALQQNPCWGSSSYEPTEEELRYLHETAETIPGPSTEALVEIARQYDIAVVFGMTEKGLDGQFYNTSVFLGPNGIFGTYRKRRLADSSLWGNEHFYWRAGSESGLVESPLGKVGLLICADLFTEFGPKLATEGADFLVTVSAWSSGPIGNADYERLTTGNAYKSQRWHIVADQVGQVGHVTGYGHSRIIDPDGRIVADTGAQEGMVIASTGIFLTPAVDFDRDGAVDLKDFSILAQYWREAESAVDIAPSLFGDGIVGIQDLSVFTEYWLRDLCLLGHWKLDETEGTIAHDSVGDKDGTLNGNPVWQPAAGKVNGALQVDGVDDYVSTSFVPDPSAIGGFSVFAWVKGGGAEQAIISQAGGVNWLAAGTSQGKLMTELKAPGRFGTSLFSEAVIIDGEWHRVGLTWDGSTRTLFADGVEVAKGTQSTLAGSAGGLYIGAGKGLEAGSFWSGLIDDVRIYDRAIVP